MSYVTSPQRLIEDGREREITNGKRGEREREEPKERAKVCLRGSELHPVSERGVKVIIDGGSR